MKGSSASFTPNEGPSMKWLLVLLLGISLSTTAAASPRPEVMEPDRVFAAFRAVTVLPVRDAQRISFDAQRRMITLRGKMAPERRQDLLDRAAASPHVGHLELLGSDTLILWLRSMRTEVVLIERGGAVTEPKLVLGERRQMIAPRAMYLGDQCVLSYTEIEDARLEKLAQSYCTGMWTAETMSKLESLINATQGSLTQTLRLLSIDAQGPTRLSGLERLAKRHAQDARFVTQAWLSLAIHMVARDELEGALRWLDRIQRHQRRAQAPWSPERRHMIELLGQGIFERLVLGNLLTGDAERAVQMYTTYRHWEGEGLVRVRRRIIQAHRTIKQPKVAAALYAELALDKRLKGGARRALYGELATTYLEAGDPYRAWHTYRYIRERFGTKGLSPDFDLYISWMSHKGSCQKARDPERCKTIPKPDANRALDLAHSGPVKEPAYLWHKTSMPIAL